MSPDKLIFAITLIVLQSMPLHAEDFYYGFSIGYGNLNQNPPTTDADEVASGITAPEGLSLVGQPTATFSFDISDKDINWKLFAGYNFNQYLSVEGGYMNFGKSLISSTLTGEMTTTLPDPLMGTQTSNAVLTTDSSINTTGIHINGIARFPFVDKFNFSNFSVFGKAGVIRWDTNIKNRQTLLPFTLQTTPDEDAPVQGLQSGRFKDGNSGYNFHFGIGADYLVTTDLGLRAEWSYYRGIDNRNLNFFSIGAFYQFPL